MGRLVADDHAVAAGAAGDVLLVLGAGARVLVTAAGAVAVDEDAVALAGDSVALAGAGAAVGGRGAVAGELAAGAGAVRAVGQVGAGAGDGGAEVGDDVLVLVDAGGSEAAAQLVLVVVDDLAGGVGRDGLGSLDLRDGQRAALGDVDGQARAGRRLAGARGRLGRAGVARGALGRRGRGGLGRRLGLGDVENVELAAGGGLDGGDLTGVVRDVVPIDDVVVPVALAGLEGGAREAESALPRARLGGGLVLGQGELPNVVVPGTEKVDGLDARRDAERERHLNSRHVDLLLMKDLLKN